MNLKFSTGLFILLLVIVAPLFAHLGNMPIQMWDEARQAIGALEMGSSHNWLINCYDGRPDMWSTKPPLLLWCQVLSMKLLGMSEFGFRFPSAMAAACTCFIIYWLFGHIYKKPWLGLISAMILVTSQGYVMIHGSRTGDYDSLLTFFTTAYCIFYFLYLQQGKAIYLYTALLAMALAVLTKGVAGLLFTPALLFYTLYRKRLLSVLKQPHFYTALFVFLFMIIGFYLLREHYNPGYIKAVAQNELGGRYGNALENHSGVFWYYFNCLKKYQFCYWYLLLIPGALAGLFTKEKELRQFTVYALFAVIIFFFVISTAQTKLYWYAMPLYPFLSVVVAVFIYYTCVFLSRIGRKNMFKRFNPLPYLLLCLLFFLPYRDTMSYVSGLPVLPANLQENEQMVSVLQSVLHNREQIGPCMVSWSDYQPNVLWYIKVLNNKKHLFKFVADNNFDSSGNALAYKSETKKYIEAHYNAQIIKIHNGVILYRLNGTRQ